MLFLTSLLCFIFLWIKLWLCFMIMIMHGKFHRLKFWTTFAISHVIRKWKWAEISRTFFSEHIHYHTPPKTIKRLNNRHIVNTPTEIINAWLLSWFMNTSPKPDRQKVFEFLILTNHHTLVRILTFQNEQRLQPLMVNKIKKRGQGFM